MNGASVPEAAIDEHSYSARSEDDIRSCSDTWLDLAIDAKS